MDVSAEMQLTRIAEILARIENELKDANKRIEETGVVEQLETANKNIISLTEMISTFLDDH